MEYLQINDITFAVYQRQGNTKNGSPIHLVNVFKNLGTSYQNVNYKLIDRVKFDKYNNIKRQTYNIKADILSLCKNI